MQRELEELLESIQEHRAYKQTFRLVDALELATACNEWPETKDINAVYQGEITISYQPREDHTRHGNLHVQPTSGKPAEHLIYEDNSSSRYVGIVSGNDTLQTHVRQRK